MAILARGAEPVETRRGLPGDPDDTHSRYIEAAIRIAAGKSPISNRLASLCARSGHRVYLLAPDVPLATHQPPIGEASGADYAADRRTAHSLRYSSRSC